MKYSDKLKDPRWQKLRLEVFQRDEFKCQSCGDSTKSLHVHHLVYHREPWDSDIDELLTICEVCHENVELAIKMVRENAGIRALSHIVNRAVMLGSGKGEWAESLLKCAISLCNLREKQEQADERAANTCEKA